MDNPYPRRNGLLGFLPILMLLLGAGVGGSIAILVGVPEVVGALAGVVAGFLVSKAILRRSFGKRSSE